MTCKNLLPLAAVVCLSSTSIPISRAADCNLSGTPVIISVLNGASFQADAGIAPYTLVTISGSGFSATDEDLLVGPDNFVDGKFPQVFACVAVEIAGQRAPITFLNKGWINLQTPALDVTGPVGAQVILNPDQPNEIRSDMKAGVAMQTHSPAFFTFDGTSIVARHANLDTLADPSVVPNAQPAKPGEIVLLFGTGFGRAADRVYQAGEIPDSMAPLQDPISVTIGGVTLGPDDVPYAGLSPGSISGLIQFKVRVPNTAPNGNVPVTIRISGWQTQDGATIPVKSDAPPPKPPAISQFTADSTSIQQGQVTMLRWSVTDATDVSIAPGIGTVPSSGSRQINPGSSTTYTLTAKGSGGMSTANVVVNVTAPPPPAYNY